MTLQRATQDGIVGTLAQGLDVGGLPAPIWIPAVQIVDGSGAGAVPGLPVGATPIEAQSGNVANAAAVATLAAVAGKTTYIHGFQITAAGATAGLPVVVTVAGLLGGTQSFIFTFPAGALVGATPLNINFGRPLPASAVNTPIVVTCPAGGAGNTNAAATAQGFQL